MRTTSRTSHPHTASPAPTFARAGAGTAVTVGQLTMRKHAASANLAAAAGRLLQTSQGVDVSLAQYHLAPKALKQVLSSEAGLRKLTSDLVMNTSRAQQTVFVNWAQTFPQTPFTVTAIKPGEVYGRALKGLQIPTVWVSPGAGHPTADEQRQLTQAKAALTTAKADLRSVAEAMLHDRPDKLVWMHWDNQDDTNIEAAVAFNTRTGTARVFKLIPAI